jgi:protein arginine kinase
MISFERVQRTEGWFQEPGNEYDVVIASRVRLSRNLVGHPFPHILKSEEEEAVRSQIVAAFSSIGFDCAVLEDLPKTERRMLLERNYISRDFASQTQKSCVLSPDRSVSGMVNDVDHLRMSVIHGGLALSACWELADEVDSRLEEMLEYAASLEWGYLNAELTNCGTGLRSSVMLHLPALVETGHIEKALKAIVQIGMTVKGFFGEDEGSRGQMYQISNQFSYGFNEKELVEKLDAVTQQLVHYERKARNEMLEHARIEVEDRVLRALGVLRFCRKLSAVEAVESLSSVRLGVALGLVQAPIERVTALLFLTQKAHVQHLAGYVAESADSNTIDAARAQMVQEALVREDVNWEDLHV